jgi:hypothetical protein
MSYVSFLLSVLKENYIFITESSRLLFEFTLVSTRREYIWIISVTRSTKSATLLVLLLQNKAIKQAHDSIN